MNERQGASQRLFRHSAPAISVADKVALLIACAVALLVLIGYVGLVATRGPVTPPADGGRSLPPLAATIVPLEVGSAGTNAASLTEPPRWNGGQIGDSQEGVSTPDDAVPPSAPLPPLRETPGLETTAPLPPIRPSEFANPMTPGLRRPSTMGSLLASGYDKWTAVYDITGRSVYLPDGTRLEAHSGLGDSLDDPRYVNVRDRGATPPHLYELELREGLFHGVQALRLTPIGEGDLFGRVGLLAHPYMLGPRGDSNGCVSFREYDIFLRAYQAGQVKRLAVVARLN